MMIGSKYIIKLGMTTLLTWTIASTAHAGFLDSINTVLNTVDRANNTADRVERSAERTAERLPAISTSQDQTQAASTAGTGQVGMTLSNASYRIGENIAINFNAPSYFDSSAWIGIVPSNVQHGSETINDQYDVSYAHLNKNTSGTIGLKAPTTAGIYDIRMHDNDTNGREIMSITINVY